MADISKTNDHSAKNEFNENNDQSKLAGQKLLDEVTKSVAADATPAPGNPCVQDPDGGYIVCGPLVGYERPGTLPAIPDSPPTVSGGTPNFPLEPGVPKFPKFPMDPLGPGGPRFPNAPWEPNSPDSPWRIIKDRKDGQPAPIYQLDSNSPKAQNIPAVTPHT